MGNEIDDFERSTRRGRQIRMLLLGCVIALPFAWVGWRCHVQRARNAAWEEESRQANALTPAEHGELDRTLPQIRAAIQRASKQFLEDVTPAKLLAALPGDQPCRQRVGTDPYVFVKPGEQPQPVVFKRAAEELEELEERIKRDGEPTRAHLEQARELSGEVGQTVVLVGMRTEPVVLADSYIPGSVRGTAYLYSTTERRIICAGDIEAENAPEVKIEYTTSNYDITGSSNKRAAANAKLAQDLSQRTRTAISRGLTSVR